MHKFDITCSIVLFKNNPTIVRRTIEDFLATELNARLFLIDNSPTPELRDLVSSERIVYIFNDNNIGFGAAHNIAIRKVIEGREAAYHLVLNPDVSFSKGTIEYLLDRMEADKSIGLGIPGVLNFEGEQQYVCKMLPRPSDLILRRLNSRFLLFLFKERLEAYELRHRDHSLQMEAPSISGCFMFLRVESLKQVGLFDERFFMYMEDIDLSRRIYQVFKNVYFPEIKIYHGHARESYKNPRLLKIHAISAFKYFNKWGWFIDRERATINASLRK